ncbi:MAG: hypothetical protein ACE5R6_18185 [Candidatus Heimdallarchaeota archaeon]
MRFLVIGLLFTGIGLAVLGIAVFIPFLLTEVEPSDLIPVYIGAIGIFAIVFISAFFTTFTEIGGYTHPDDMLFSNIFAFLYAVCAVLSGGVFFPAHERLLFDLASMIIVAYGFLILLTVLGPRLGVGSLAEEELERGKQSISRYMLFSLIIGGIIGLINMGFGMVYTELGFNWAAIGLIVITAIVVVFMGFFFRTQYAIVEE